MQQFARAQPVEGATDSGDLAAHWASVARQSGQAVTVEAEEERWLPPVFQPLWEGFLVLAARRSQGGMASNPVSYRDVQDWATLTGRTLTPWDVHLLLRWDDAFLQAQRPKSPEAAA